LDHELIKTGILFALLNFLFISMKKMYFHDEVVHELAIVDNPNETCACSRDRGRGLPVNELKAFVTRKLHVVRE